MLCEGCGNENAFRLQLSSDGWCCNGCGGLGNARIHDVYFREPYLDPNLAHYKRPQEAAAGGVWVTSKAHKAALMREQKVHEAGDHRGGARNFDPAMHRRVKEQGGMI